MPEAPNAFLRSIRQGLEPAPALEVALRLVLVRRLELELEVARGELEKAHAEELASLSPESNAARLRELLRERVRAFPRTEDSIARIARLDGADCVEALVRFAGDVSGTLGERLRAPGFAAGLRGLQERGRLGATLDELLVLRLSPAELKEPEYDALERSIYDLLRGGREDRELADAWAAFRGEAGEGQGASASLFAATPEVSLELDHDPRVNWAMEQSGVPIVHQARIRSTCDRELEDLRLRIVIGPEISEPLELRCGRLAPGELCVLERPDLRLRGERLQEVLEREMGALHVELRDGERVLLRESRPIDILAFNEWDRRAFPELLAAFVLPNDPSVQRILESARDLLRDVTGDPSLLGYQSRSRERVRATIDAVYRAIQKLDITYTTPPASFSEGCQKVRFPGRVLEHRMGTCLDLTLLLAAALEQCGLHPLVVLVEGHALPGVWLVEDWLPVASSDDPLSLRKLVAAGEVLLFDAATASLRPPQPLLAAESEAMEHLEDKDDEFLAVIDVRAARLGRVLPLRVQGGSPVGGAASGQLAGGELSGGDRAEGETAPADAPGLPVDASTAPGVGPGRARPEDAAALRARHRRIETWKERLLDLSLHNRLLNFRPSREKSVAIAVPELALLEDLLSSGVEATLDPEVKLDEADPRVAELLATRGAEELLREERASLLKSGRILTRHTEQDLDRRLIAMFREARLELEETGSSTLYLALGFLRWFETTDQGAPPRLAPILLLPVEVLRPTARSRFRLRLRDDDYRINETLLEKLRLDFGVDLTDLRELPFDASGVDVNGALSVARRAIARVGRFEVVDEACVAFFSFSKYLLWEDLHRHEDDLLRNDLVRHLVTSSAGDTLAHDAFADPRDLDALIPPRKTRLALDADSSQHVAIDAALKGLSFVLQGPPGTGKSQTIANIIAECIAAGKRVLFVAEKRAALEVVARRLRSVGLGDFCLELHSNKTSKREVVLELARVYETRVVAGQKRDLDLPDRVAKGASRLNQHLHALHAETALGLSCFQCIGRLLELEEAPRADLSLEGALEVDRETHSARLEALEALTEAAGDLPMVVDHPFRASRAEGWTLARSRRWQEELQALEGASRELQEAASSARGLLGLEGEGTIAGSRVVRQALALLAEGVPEGAGALLQRKDREAVVARLRAAMAKAAERRALLDGVEGTFEPALCDSPDLEPALRAFKANSSAFFLLRWLRLRRWKQALLGYAHGKLPTGPALIASLEKACAARDLGRALDELQPFLSEHVGARAEGASTDFSSVGTLLELVSRWGTVCRDLERLDGASPASAPEELATRPGVSDAMRKLGDGLGVFTPAFSAVVAGLVLDEAAAFGATNEGFTPSRVLEASRLWLQSLPLLRAWTRFTAAESRVLGVGLASILPMLRSGALRPSSLVHAYERAFFQRRVEEGIEASEGLRAFNGREHDRIVEAFRRDDAALISSGGRVLAGELAKDRPVPGANVHPTSEPGILQREARKKARHLSIRRLFSEIPNLLPRLKPCLLMSPLSITQFLPPWREPFDVVVFDEASQIPTHDAIGAMARGRQVIVVGDSRQLPPTTFFMTAHQDDELPGEGEQEAEEGELLEELESILDECVASQVPSIMLQWHYRSLDERLIAFSNRYYYENRLVTFPAPAQNLEGRGVSLQRVDGVFDRGKSRTNPVEAERIVRWIVEALLDPARRGRSIGVVTFNLPQQLLIEDLLDAERRLHPEIEPYFDDRAPEPVFVKNLENVQGDERDAMLFSTTYGPDTAGRIHMSFGPLNAQGGERRLNVAVTRARIELIVFTSLGWEKIDLSRTRALGVAHLKAFLQYAELGPGALARLESERDSSSGRAPFEEAVAAKLSERGHQVVRAVGCSSCRVDLAIRDPEQPARCLLGIECDGETYRASATARDRDRLRHAVLERLGWSLHSLWSLDWLQDPRGELERLEETLRSARSAAADLHAISGANAGVEQQARRMSRLDDAEGDGERDHEGAAEDATEDATEDAVKDAMKDGSEAASEADGHDVGAPAPVRAGAGTKAGSGSRVSSPPIDGDALEPYESYEVTEAGSPESFEEARSRRTLARLLVEVARVEAPIHREALFRRVAACYSIARLGKRTLERLQEMLEKVISDGRLKLEGEFVWLPDQQPATWASARGPEPGGEPRDLELIPLEEMQVAAARILSRSVALPREELARAAAALMGFRRFTAKTRDAFLAGVDRLALRGGCEVVGGVVRLPPPSAAAGATSVSSET